MYSTPKIIILISSNLACSLKKDPVRCGKMCDKSWVILMYVLADFNQPLFITHLMNGLHEEGRRQKKKVMVRFIHQVSFNFVAEQLA